MLYSALKLAHVLAITIWMGGMVFAHCFLRPAVQTLEPPQRLRLMHEVLRRFLGTVSVLVIVTLASGLAMIGQVAFQARSAGTSGSFVVPLDWTLMAALGLLMMGIFGHIRFALFGRLQRAVAVSDWPAGAQALAGIRRWVGVNLIVGLLIVALVILL